MGEEKLGLRFSTNIFTEYIVILFKRSRFVGLKMSRNEGK